MKSHGSVARLTDIIEAIELIRQETEAVSISNILRHDYERVAYDVIWRVVQDDLPPLESVCRLELKALETGPSRN